MLNEVLTPYVEDGSLPGPITVYDVLTSQAGWGWASDFSLPAVRASSPVQRDAREPQSFPATDVWLAELSRVPRRPTAKTDSGARIPRSHWAVPPRWMRDFWRATC